MNDRHAAAGGPGKRHRQTEHVGARFDRVLDGEIDESFPTQRVAIESERGIHVADHLRRVEEARHGGEVNVEARRPVGFDDRDDESVRPRDDDLGHVEFAHPIIHRLPERAPAELPERPVRCARVAREDIDVEDAACVPGPRRRPDPLALDAVEADETERAAGSCLRQQQSLGDARAAGLEVPGIPVPAFGIRQDDAPKGAHRDQRLGGAVDVVGAEHNLGDALHSCSRPDGGPYSRVRAFW